MGKIRLLPSVFLVALAACLPACVVSLSDPEQIDPQGSVSGPPADCAVASSEDPGPARIGTTDGPRLVGRFSTTNPARPEFSWSGTQMTARFTGSSIVALRLNADQAINIEGDPADPASKEPAPYTVVIDGGAPFIIDVVEGANEYMLATGLDPAATHEVVVHRDAEAAAGNAVFLGFRFDDGGKLLPPTERPRRIEIIGDSITCGYGIQGKNASCRFTYATESSYKAYGSITGRTLDAEVHQICVSGKGVFRNNNDSTDQTLPVVYDRILLNAKEESPLVDYAAIGSPDVIVLAFGTNDFHDNTVPDLVAFKKAYSDFLDRLRKLHPKAHLFLAVPPMLDDYNPAEVRSVMSGVLRELVADRPSDSRIYTMAFYAPGTRHGLGCAFHPNLETHGIMADQLVGAIRSKTCWSAP